MMCTTQVKGSFSNSTTQGQRKKIKAMPRKQFLKERKISQPCPNQPDYTAIHQSINNGSRTGNSTCRLLTKSYTQPHTLRRGPAVTWEVWATLTTRVQDKALGGPGPIRCGVLDTCLGWNKKVPGIISISLYHSPCFPFTLMLRPSSS